MRPNRVQAKTSEQKNFVCQSSGTSSQLLCTEVPTAVTATPQKSKTEVSAQRFAANSSKCKAKKCGPKKFEIVPGTGLGGYIKPVSDTYKGGIEYEACLRKTLAVQDTTKPIYWTNNGDINTIPQFVAAYSKCLQHDKQAHVVPTEMKKLLGNINGDRNSMQNYLFPAPIAVANPPPGVPIPIINPNNMYNVNLFGRHPSSYSHKVAPTFHSDETAGEMVEMYCASLTRDVPFSEYETDPLIAKCCDYLNELNVFKGPKENGLVTPKTFLQFTQTGTILPGPRLSQLWYYDIPQNIIGNGAETDPIQPANGGYNNMTSNPQKNRWVAPGVDYLWRLDDEFARSPICLVQGGYITEGTVAVDSTEPEKYRTTCRDVAASLEEISRVFIGQGFMASAYSIIQAIKFSEGVPIYNNPYSPFRNGVYNPRLAFTDYDSLDLSWVPGSVDKSQLDLAQKLKWSNMRVRPEAIAIEVQKVKLNDPALPHYYQNTQLLDSGVLEDVFEKYQSYFLPMFDVLGCVPEPSYPSGYVMHVGGIMSGFKALFSPEDTIPAFEPSEDAESLVPILDDHGVQVRLNLFDEIDKYVYNHATSRVSQCVHYRSDIQLALDIGEEVVINHLREHAARYAYALPTKPFVPGPKKTGYLFRRFNGTFVDILVPNVDDIVK